MARNRSIGVALTVAAVVLAVAAVSLWLWSSYDAEQRQDQAEVDAIFMGHTVEEIEPNRAPAIAVGAVAAVLFLSGSIYLAVSPPREPEPSDRQ
jgi:hypothetical protein